MLTAALLAVILAADRPERPQQLREESTPVAASVPTPASPPSPFRPKIDCKSKEFVAGEMNLINISGVDFSTYASSKIIMRIYPRDGSIQMIDNLSVSQKKVIINVQPRKKGPNTKYWFVFCIGGTGEFVYLEHEFKVVDREVTK